MFTMGQKIKDISPKELFEEQSANDYWDEGGKNIGKWFGKLSEKWGMKDRDVSEEDFTKVMKHQCPWDDKPLTTATKKDGISFYPFQCACQKSVSIMAVIGGDHRLYDAHLKCVKMALSELEKFAAHRVRTGQDRTSDKTAGTGNILAALFTHDSSRALDPQLHTHCNIANVTITKGGKRMALTESQMMKAVEYAGRFYQSMMARECMELGYRITTKRGSKGIEGFEIEGVSPEIIQRFSRRRAEIEESIEKFRQEHGREPFPAEINIMALETREAKLREISTAEVRNLQKAMLSVKELSDLNNIRRQAVSSVRKDLQPSEKERIISRAMEALYERQTVLPRHAIYAEALKWGMGRITREDVERSIQKHLIKLSDGENNLSALFTTRQWLDLEKEAVQSINNGVGRFEQMGNSRPDMGRLSTDQKAAVEGVLSCQDFAVIVRGAAGAGKTTALRELDKGLKASGRDVFYLAPTRGAVNVLKEDGFDATTVTRFLMNPPKLSRNSIIVVDEGSLVSNAIGNRLLQISSRNGARIVINGDEKQHTSVDAGDWMRMIETSCNIRKYELLEIKRQIPENYRLAIRAMATGYTANGLELLKEMGAVREEKANYLSKAAEIYSDSVLSGKKTMLVAPTHAEIDAMTAIVRERLVRAGRISSDNTLERQTFCDYGFTKSELASSANYRPGMAVRFNLKIGTATAGSIRTIKAVRDEWIIFEDGSKRRAPDLKNIVSLGENRVIAVAPGDKLLITANDRAAGLTNGDVVQVAKTENDEILLTNGKKIPANFESFSYGYATTSHKSQGATTSHVVLAASTLSDKACYVGSSRGREKVTVVCPEFEPLLHSVRKNTDRMTIHEAELQGKELIGKEKC